MQAEQGDSWLARFLLLHLRRSISDARGEGMTNRVPRLLLTGDYWHSDFQGLIGSSVCVTTLVPEDKLDESHLSKSDFDLVVVAASRRNQFSAQWIETLRSDSAPTPVVAVLGSWCEGEQRSGTPWPGVKRIYWHQWRGRFDCFATQLTELGTSAWNLPGTANDADIIEQICQSEFDSNVGAGWHVGISSLSETAYQMLDDAICSVGGKTSWIERQQWDAGVTDELSVVCVEADSWSESVEARVKWLRDDLEIEAPIVVVLNFPRRNDVDLAQSVGVSEVVSKPFQLIDLAAAIERSISENASSSIQ
jgi:hypothetical protein